MISTESTRALATAVLDYIAAHPEKHDQREFISDPDHKTGCGTTMCIAGTANWLTNGVRALAIDSEEEARKLLGLSFGEAEAVFYEMSNKRALAKVRKIAAGEQFDTEDFYTNTNAEDDNADENNYALSMRDEY